MARASHRQQDPFPAVQMSKKIFVRLSTRSLDALRVNPAEKFWQFHFQEDATKPGNSIRSILPRRLIPLLEDYLQNHRPNILADFDPGTLFLTQSGGARDRQATTDLVAQLVLEHAGRR